MLHRPTWTAGLQLVSTSQKLAPDTVCTSGVPVPQPSTPRQWAKVVAADGNCPPLYGTTVSVSPMNVSTGMLRDGTQAEVGLIEIGNATGAAAAKRSAASQASRCDIAPPFERPVA